MKIKKALEDFTEGKILFSGLKTSHMEANTQKGRKNGELGLRMHSHAPRA